MKSILKIFFLILLPFATSAQVAQMYRDSLLTALNHAANDTVRLDINRKLGFYYQDSEADPALIYHEAQLALAKKLKLKLWEADAYQQIAYCYTNMFKLSAAYENYMLALKIAEDPSSAANAWGFADFSFSKSPDEARQSIVGMIHFELASLYNRTRYYQMVLPHLFKALAIGKALNNLKILSITNRDIGIYYLTNKPDSAFIYFQKALEYYQLSTYKKNKGVLYLSIGQYYIQKQQYDSAKINLRIGMDISADPASLGLLGNLKQTLGQVYLKTGQLDSALIYTLQGQDIVRSLNALPLVSSGFTQLGSIYLLKKEYAIAYDFLEKGKNLGDSLSDNYINRLMQFQNLDFDQKIRLQEMEKQNQLAKSRNRMYALLAGLGIFLLVAILLYRNNRQKQKANKVLASTLTNLKATQAQLIQSEKMASLGELTAGIAHEIQNPLNFVNNFSEVSTELVQELKEELDKGDIDEAKVISDDIIQNLEKINHHGKRASDIVKGMLDHSRTSSGQKVPTDINKLADEYLRLAYHGLRAKDNSFNAKLETHFDADLPLIDIVPQDIGRVILNLITNAFYAVNDRTPRPPEGGDPWEPTVTVCTKRISSPSGVGGKVEIRVADNGNGIPLEIKDKIFQPFFTTKPTGQGTGLGLSLAYDIVKAHGGELRVETAEGKGSMFIIQLPV